MKNFFKHIWNYFFRKKKAEVKDYGCQPISVPALESCGEPCVEHKVEKPKPHTPIYYFVHHKMSFKKPQPIGRILTFGKERFRIHSRISLTNRFKYDIEKLI